MKTRSILSFLLLFPIWELCIAQVTDDKILMTVAGREVSAGEFIRMYNKGLDSATRTDVDEYMEQFTRFKLKVADALSNGTDTTKTFRNELDGYRKQLARNYLTDPYLKDTLIRRAYRRSLSDIRASHILVSCPSDASPKDTLEAYRKAVEVRKRILKGESFEKVAGEESDDKSAAVNGGNLGYFTVFQMIKPFEDAAYTLKPGSLSEPVRTSFGYHIIYVTGRRPSPGKIKVAHIMKTVPQGADEKALREAESEINKLYEQLREGGSFSNLAKEYSDHKESAARNGELSWFGTGEIISDFSEAAFSLKDTGEYTKPVRTIFGFHIIKLLEKKSPSSFEEAKPLLESKINASETGDPGRVSFITKLKDEYNFRVNTDVLNWFARKTDTLVMKGRSVYNRKKMPKDDIYSFADQHFTANDFAKAIEEKHYKVEKADPQQFIETYIGLLSSDQIYNFENSVLEKKYPEFRYLMKEFHDGILLFDISSKMVWDRIRVDTAGLRRYYDDNRNNFLSGRAAECKVYSLKAPDGIRRLSAAFRKYSGKSGSDDKMLKRFNRRGDTLLTINNKVFHPGDDAEVDKIEWSKGVFCTFIRNNVSTLIFVSAILEPSPRPFRDCQAEVINGYQDQLMTEWIGQLKNKYPVEVDKSVYNEVKKMLSNE